MRLKCKYVSADEAGDEIFQILFKVKRDQDGGPYLLIQRAFLEEDEGESGPCYVETHEERLIGYYPNLEAELTRGRLTLRLPPPVDETIEVEFLTSDAGFSKVRRVLGIILQRDFGEHGQRNGSSGILSIPSSRQILLPLPPSACNTPCSISRERRHATHQRSARVKPRDRLRVHVCSHAVHCLPFCVLRG